jgi:hypothetical protein
MAYRQTAEKIDTVDRYLPPPKQYTITMTPKQMQALRKAGYSYQQIGDAAGCTKQAIWLRLNGFEKEQAELADYKEHEADVLVGLRARIVKELDTDAIQKMAPRDRVMAYGILYDKSRLQDGLSTANLSVHNDLEAIKAMQSGDKP